MTESGSSRLSVLLVDDDVVLLDALERAFNSSVEEFRVVAIGSFAEARRALQTNHFDVLITDVRLGAFNGLQLALLARGLNPGIQLIAFSGFEDAVLKREAERLGAVYLVKPVSSHSLFELIRNRPARI